MRIARVCLVAFLTLCVLGLTSVQAQGSTGVAQPAKAEELYALANRTRAEMGRGRLQWDAALAAAAMQHCMRMAAEGPISHRYGGEPDLTARAGAAGAHFSVIEENIAVGSYPARIHQEWMDSPGHRANLLAPEIDRVGIAVVAARGVLYAAADYSRGVAVLSPTDVESQVERLLRDRRVVVRRDPTDARAACRLDHGMPSSSGGAPPQFVMRWQDADLSHLPRALEDRLASGQYRQAEVGSCPARNTEGSFTAYRVAVLLY